MEEKEKLQKLFRGYSGWAQRNCFHDLQLYLSELTNAQQIIHLEILEQEFYIGQLVKIIAETRFFGNKQKNVNVLQPV